MRDRIDIPMLGAWILAVGMIAGCQTPDPETKVVVPSAATQAPEYEGDGSVPEQKYVIRMSDGKRDWEVQFPEVATGYEMHIPLEEARERGPLDSVRWESENLTEADKELLEQLRRERGKMEREQINVDGRRASAPSGDSNNGEQTDGGADSSASSDGSGKAGSNGASAEGNKNKSDQQASGDTDPAPYRPSYLLGIEEVRKLYKAGKYELAMVKIKKLDQAYPDDEKILSMKGTLWMKLGRENLAREAWERVLQINPDNQQVKEALKRLQQSE
jgi:tetratricopeptide (TPR) repeat protein